MAAEEAQVWLRHDLHPGLHLGKRHEVTPIALSEAKAVKGFCLKLLDQKSGTLPHF